MEAPFSLRMFGTGPVLMLGRQDDDRFLDESKCSLPLSQNLNPLLVGRCSPLSGHDFKNGNYTKFLLLKALNTKP